MQRDVVQLPPGASVCVTTNGLIMVTSDEMGRIFRAMERTRPDTIEYEMVWARYMVESKRISPDCSERIPEHGYPPVPIGSHHIAPGRTIAG